jgi:hypothetical protein
MTGGVAVRWTALNTLAGCTAAGTKAARTPPCCTPEITTLGHRGSLRTVCRDLQPLRTHQHRAPLTPSTSKSGEATSWLLGRIEDLAAVTAGLTLPCSSGLAEGNVNRTKANKRQVCVHARPDLLRKRVMHHPP